MTVKRRQVGAFDKSSPHMTEVGQLPRDWQISSLGKLFEVQQGKAMSAESRNGPAPKPFLRTSNVLWGKIDLSSVDRMHFTDEEVRKYALQPGDLLVCEGGEVGRAAIWDNELPGCLYQNHIHRLRRIGTNVEPKFAMYWLQEAILHLNIYEGAANRTTIPNLSAARLKEFAIPFPQPEEQRAIAAVLSKIQTAAETQGKIVAGLKELKAATMAKLFRKGLHNEPLKETEIGKIPESWEVRQLRTVCMKTKTYDLRMSPDKEFKYVDVSSVSSEDFQITTTLRHTTMSAPSRARKPVLEGDVILATVRPTLKRLALIPKQLEGQIVSTAFCVLRPDQCKAISEYLYYVVQRPELFAALGSIQHGASYPAVTDKDVLGQPIPLPGRDEQAKIVAILSTIDRGMHRAKSKAAILNSLFTSMLERLLSGMIRTRK